MNEKQFKQQSHDLVVNIASTMGTFTTGLELTDEDLAKTQKLVKKFDETLSGFIDGRKPKFEVGDYFVKDLGSVFVIGVITGKVSDKFVTNWYDRCDNSFNEGVTERRDNMLHATPEEIAEYKAALNFHDHGRKPFEIKTGDMLHYSINATNQIVKRAKEWGKGDFILARYTLLKTAEELEEWLADGQ